MVASVASRRSTASSVPIQPKSRAAAVDSSKRPILVGDVRWATTGFGSSWKLSGGSMLSAAVTNVSKKRQVRRAISRSDAGIGRRDRQAAGIGRRHAHPARDRRRDQPGEDEGRRDRHRRRPATRRTKRPATAMRRLPAIWPAKPSQSVRRRLVGLGRGDPLEQVAAADEQPEQGPADRIHHQPGLMGEKGDEQRGLRSASNDIRRERRQMAAHRDGGMPRQEGGDHRQDRRQGDRQQDEARPDERGGKRQGPARQQRQERGRRRQACAADCRTSSRSRSP